jgi:hypothetical protein
MLNIPIPMPVFDMIAIEPSRMVGISRCHLCSDICNQ